MNPASTAAPQGGMFDIRWRIFGMQFRIQPSFWIVNAIFAWLIYGYVTGFLQIRADLLNYILVWLICTFVSVLIHEMGHVITGRIFGQPGNVTLAGFGGQTTGEYEQLRVWQRILFYAAGPAAGFGLVVFLVFFDPYTTGWNRLADEFNRPKWKLEWCIIDQIDPLMRMGASRMYPLILAILLIFTLFSNILNLLPIIPLDGGMIFKEFCCLIFPRTGLMIAFIWSMFWAIGAASFYLVVVLINYRVLPTYFVYPFLLPELSLFAFAVMAYRSYASFRELASATHHSHYMERD
ncbi:MAG: hypothetical protein EXS16_07680 [Gemmataceae bacterium]|nr:hypothetical protein [Gemmataceae bacterium]